MPKQERSPEDLSQATELLQLRMALAEEQARLADVLAAARMATWRLDLQTGQITVSESMASLWGLLPGQSFAEHAQQYQLLHPEDRDRHQDRVRKAISSSGSWHAEFRAVRPRDGRIAWLEERGTLRPDPLTQHTMVNGLLRDVTERKVAEAVLRQSEARKSFLQHLKDVLRPLSDPMRIQFEAARVLGKHLGADRAYYTGPQGEHSTSVSPSPLPDSLLEAPSGNGSPCLVTDTGLSHSLTTEVRAAYQALGIRAFASAPVIKEGEQAWTLNVLSGTAREWTPEEVTLIKEVAERTSAALERAKTELALRATDERFREFATASDDILWIRDAGTLRLEFVSAAFRHVYGAAMEDLVGNGGIREWARLIEPQDRKRVFNAFRELQAGRRVTHEYRVIRPYDRQVRWIRDTDFPLPGNGASVQHIGGIARDVTEEKQASDRLQVLVRELQHRTRNQIAVVRSISDKTLSQCRSLQEYKVLFGERLAAVARVQFLLSRLSEGERVSFDQLLWTELSAHGAPSERVFLEGPTGVRLRSSTVQTLALALHELATNSVKYGAISSPQGRLYVGWHVFGNADGTHQRLNVDWRETGIDSVQLARGLDHHGYGRELIEQALPYQLNARTHYEIGPEGVHCVIDVPISGSIPPSEV